MIGIYKIENKKNNRVYVGESMHIERRWEKHKDDLNNNSHHSWKLQQDWNVYGKYNFEFSAIYDLNKETRKHNSNSLFIKLYLVWLENKYIEDYNSICNGYNIDNTLISIIEHDKPIFGDTNWYGSKPYLLRLIDTNGECFFINVNPSKRNLIFNNAIEYVINNIYEYDYASNKKISDMLKSVGVDIGLTKNILKEVDIDRAGIKHKSTDIKHGFKLIRNDNTQGNHVFYDVVPTIESARYIIDLIIENGTDYILSRDIRKMFK